MDIDAATLASRDAYALLTSLVVPRPIAWVTTLHDGHVNVAPFSFWNGLGSDPPMVTLAVVARRDGSDKDTLRLLQQTGVCCVHLVEEPDLDRMNQTSAELPPDESEAVRFGIATVPCTRIAGVRIASARAAMECRLVDVHRYGRRQKVALVVLEVVGFFIDDALLVPGTTPVRVDGARVHPVARLGGDSYAFVGERPVRGRPPV
jgi:flavin reductase (DIM6/NTAB) family NADH-FMN oxidoreductase RutF